MNLSIDTYEILLEKNRGDSQNMIPANISIQSEMLALILGVNMVK